MTPFFLQSARLELRHWTQANLPLAQSLWQNPEVARFTHANGSFSLEEASARLEGELDTQRRCGLQYWPVFLLSTQSFVGCCGLRPYEQRPSTFELGVHLLPEFWHQGLAQEVARRVIDHAFQTLNADALCAGHNPGNTASRKLLARLGFAYTHDAFYAPTGLQHPSYLLIRPR